MTMPSGDGHKREPIECHDKCPECGCEERLVANFVAELKEQGVISVKYTSSVWNRGKRR